MKRKIAIWILIVAVLQPGLLLAQVAVPGTAAAAAASAGVDAPAQSLQIVAGRSTVLDLGTPITRVSLTNPDVADALVTTNSQLLIHGKAPGTISMFVWEKAGGVRRYDISVGRDVTRLNDQFRELFPRESIQVSSNGRNVVLSGHVTTKEIAEKAANLAGSFVDKKEEVVSLLQVQAGPTNQVLLKVRFAEVSRSALTELGLNIFTSPTGINNTLGRLTTQQFSAPGYSDLQVTKTDVDRNGNPQDPFKFGADVATAKGNYAFSDFLNLFILSEKYDLGVLIRALQTRGLFQSLAEPNLVAESGKEASFLAGGEFPIPVAQAGGGNAITIEFKEFGVRLSFTPVVDGDRIHLKVRPEVSTLDFANGIQLQGFRIPALTSRRTETELELRNGQTFAIAGLLNNSMTSTMQKIPGIGDIPILGYLFRSKAAQKNRTELVVMITPQLLREGSSGVTDQLPKLKEPFLSPLRENESVAPPPAAFPQSSTAATTPGLAAAPTDPVEPLATPAPIVVQSASAAPVVDPRAAERAEKADAERAKAEAKALKAQQETAARVQRAAAAEERRRLEEEKIQQEKVAKEQAKRDAEEGRRKAIADRKAAEEAQRQAEAEKKRQAALDAAAARVKAAEAQYQSEIAKSGTAQ